MIAPYEAHGMNPYDIRKKCGVSLYRVRLLHRVDWPQLTNSSTQPPLPVQPNPLCYDTSSVTKFLSNQEVLTKLGVEPGKVWQSCNYTVNSMFRCAQRLCSLGEIF
jgi:cathepsin A (carboxypeptidase C)